MDSHDVVKAVNRLIETCKDGEYGFRTSADHARDPQLQRLLRTRCEECRGAAAELQGLSSQYGGIAVDGGTTAGSMHRGWVALKSALTGYTDLAILEECERGEDSAIDRYRSALDSGLPDSVRLIVQQQYEGLQRNHQQIRTLRDSMRTARAA